MLTLLNANALSIPLADKSVQCVVTSPPYWGLRSYGIGTENGELGLEQTPAEYVENMVQVFREVWRVLRDDGVLWLNLGDSYAGGSRDSNPNGKQGTNRGTVEFSPGHFKGFVPNGLKPKDLVGIPWRVAFALQADGWYLRSAPPWIKGNCMPESVKDRFTVSHEYWFFLTKKARCYYDADAIRTPHKEASIKRQERAVSFTHKNVNGAPGQTPHSLARPRPNIKGLRTASEALDEGKGLHPGGRNYRTSDVFWQGLDDTINNLKDYIAHLEYVRENGGVLLGEDDTPMAMIYNTKPFRGSHFATFSPDMVTPLIKCSTSERGCCPVCGAPWERVTERVGHTEHGGPRKRADAPGAEVSPSSVFRTGVIPVRETVGWKPTCAHDAEPVPCIVLDPFAGSGTTGMVARQLGRSFVGLDLSFYYLHDIARRRLELDALDAWTNGIQAGSDVYHDLPLFAGEGWTGC